MRLVVVAVRDSAVNGFLRPFFVNAVGAAVRSFGDESIREAPENMMFHHPEDFELFELGSWDEESARFSLLDEPRSLARAKDFPRKGFHESLKASSG